MQSPAIVKKSVTRYKIQFIFGLIFSFVFFLIFIFEGNDIRFDGGLTLALAFWSRSAVLLQLNRGADALVDIQCAIDNGLEQIKSKPEYFARLAKANARKLKLFRSLKAAANHLFCFFFVFFVPFLTV